MNEYLRALWLHPGVICRYTISRLFNTFPAARVVSTITEVELLKDLKAGKSLIRFGDGELMLLLGKSIHFQPYHPELRKALHKLISDYSQTAPYRLALPLFALTEQRASLQERGRVRIWRLFRIAFPHFFNTSNPYADAIYFYRHQSFEKVLSAINPSHIVLLTNQSNQTSELKALLIGQNISHTFITTNDQNAYSNYERYKNEVESELSNYPDAVVLTAMGPAGKVLCYDLTIQHKVQCLDVGHGIEIAGKEADLTDKL